MLFLNVDNVYLHRTKNVKENVFLAVFHLRSFLGFLDSWKKKSNSPYFCVWGWWFQPLCLNLFSVFCLLLAHILLIHIFVHYWLQKWRSLEIFKSRLLFLILLARSLGSLHLCLSFLIDYPIFKEWDSKCPILLCKI